MTKRKKKKKFEGDIKSIDYEKKKTTGNGKTNSGIK